MKKLLTLVLVLAFALCLFVPAFASGEPSGEASAETAGGKSVEEAYVEYIHEWLLAELAVNSNMTIEQVEDEFMPLIEAGDYTSFPAEMLWSGMLNNGVAMTFEEFAAQYVPAGGVTPGEYTDGTNVLVIADDLTFVCTSAGESMDATPFVLTIRGTVAEDGTVTITSLADGDLELIDMASAEQIAKDTATVEALVAMAMTAGGASGEAGSDEEAFIEYIHEWLLAELAVNSNMTIEQVEDEFMPLVREMDFATFPAEMIYSGMLEQGVPMTFEEFIASR